MADTTETTKTAKTIQVSHLSKYDFQSGERKIVLDDLSFNVSMEAKGIHGILGPKGAGKSTLLAILSGSAEADGGTVYIKGKEIHPHGKEQRKRIGFVPEIPVFYHDMTVEETLDFMGQIRDVPADKRYRQIKEALELVGLDEIRGRLVRYLTMQDKKRLSVAGALLGNPEVLLLDEPISAKDTATRSEFQNLIRMLGKIKTIVLASSDFKTVRELCEDVVILSDGKILAKDRFEVLEEKLLRNRVLHVNIRGDAQTAIQAVRSLAGVSGCGVKPSNKTGEVALKIEYRAETDIREAVSTLMHELGMPILSMTVETLSLEAVYHSLTSVYTGTVHTNSAKSVKKGENE